MPQQLSSLELSPWRERLESYSFTPHGSFLPFWKKQKELKRQRIREEETRSSEELERGHRSEKTVSGNLHYQRIQRTTNPQMVLDSGEGTVKADGLPQQCLAGRRAPTKLSAKSTSRKMANQGWAAPLTGVDRLCRLKIVLR